MDEKTPRNKNRGIRDLKIIFFIKFYIFQSFPDSRQNAPGSNVQVPVNLTNSNFLKIDEVSNTDSSALNMAYPKRPSTCSDCGKG